MPQARTLVLALCAIASTLSLAGCSYHFQETHNPLLDLGIRKIYVSGFKNQTYRPGIEHYFSTAMVREIASSKSFVLVNSEKDADAILSGNVSAAEDNVASTNYVTVQDRQLPVASEYDATVSCSIQLVDRHGRTVFAQSVAADKVHPGSGAVGDVGASGNTNNDSEQRLAIQFLANQMMASVYQRMVDTF